MPAVSLVVVCRPLVLVDSRHRVTFPRDAGFLAVSRATAVVTPMATVALSGPVVTIREPRSAPLGVRVALRLLHLQAVLPLTFLMC